MRRRTFLAALPCAAASGSLLGPVGQSSAAAPPEEAAPGSWTEGEARFIRSDVHAGNRPFGASFAPRSAVPGLAGAAGTAHPLATLAGIEILKRGGSAVDAAIAINACLGFLEPTSSGIGGDVFAMIWDPGLGQGGGLPGSGRAPRGPGLGAGRSRGENRALAPLRAAGVSGAGAA